MNRRIVLPLLAVLVAANAPAAGAAAPWSAPVTLSAPNDDAAGPSILFGPAGGRLVSWEVFAEPNGHSTHLAPARGPVRTIAGGSEGAVTYGRDRLALVRGREIAPAHCLNDRRGHTRLDVAFGRMDGTIGRWQQIAAASYPDRVAFAASPRGDLVVAWLEADWVGRDCIGGVGAKLKVALRRPGGSFALGMAPDGTATVAWTQTTRGARAAHLVRVATTGGRARFGLTAVLAQRGRVEKVAVGPDGSTLVVWGRLPADITIGPDQIVTALRPAAATAFGPPETVPAGNEYDSLDAAFDPITGRPSIVWAEYPGQLSESGERVPRRIGLSTREP